MWQEVHTAVTVRPFLNSPSPCTDMEKFSRIRSWGMSWVSETGEPSWWHCPHSAGMFMIVVGELGSVCARTSCPPWQVTQSGASSSPRAAACPCRLRACCRVLAKGLNASPGAASGQIVFTADEAEESEAD